MDREKNGSKHHLATNAGRVPLARGRGTVLGFDLRSERRQLRPLVGVLGHRKKDRLFELIERMRTLPADTWLTAEASSCAAASGP